MYTTGSFSGIASVVFLAFFLPSLFGSLVCFLFPGRAVGGGKGNGIGGSRKSLGVQGMSAAGIECLGHL